MSTKKVILVSGSSGQLGQTLLEKKDLYTNQYDFFFADRTQLDLSSEVSISECFLQVRPDIFLNFGAYTQVDKAEESKTEAFLINQKACAILAKLCVQNNCHLVHISTDYVYSGTGHEAFKETHIPVPINTYGKSKLAGEKEIIKSSCKYTVIRTSWLYSKHRNNFVKSMIKYGQERSSLQVVNDQIGSPTWTEDLIDAIFTLLQQEQMGIFNYSNEGACSWYEFTKLILELKQINCIVNPIPSAEFATIAKRPAYSLMDKSKFKKITGKEIPNWADALKDALQQF